MAPDSPDFSKDATRDPQSGDPQSRDLEIGDTEIGNTETQDSDLAESETTEVQASRWMRRVGQLLAIEIGRAHV